MVFPLNQESTINTEKKESSFFDVWFEKATQQQADLSQRLKDAYQQSPPPSESQLAELKKLKLTKRENVCLECFCLGELWFKHCEQQRKDYDHQELWLISFFLQKKMELLKIIARKLKKAENNVVLTQAPSLATTTLDEKTLANWNLQAKKALIQEQPNSVYWKDFGASMLWVGFGVGSSASFFGFIFLAVAMSALPPLAATISVFVGVFVLGTVGFSLWSAGKAKERIVKKQIKRETSTAYEKAEKAVVAAEAELLPAPPLQLPLREISAEPVGDQSKNNNRASSFSQSPKTSVVVSVSHFNPMLLFPIPQVQILPVETTLPSQGKKPLPILGRN